MLDLKPGNVLLDEGNNAVRGGGGLASTVC